MTSVRRAILLSIIERYFFIAIAIGSGVIIARLLTPEQIGVYSVCIAVVGIAQSLRDFGVGNYLIQERSLEDEKVATAFGLSLLMGCALFVATVSAAPLVAQIYSDDRLSTTLAICSLNFLILPFNTISVSLLRREMEFKKLVYVAMASSAVGAGSTVGLAIVGMAENALAIGTVAGSFVSAAGAWLARRDRRLIAPSFRYWRSVLAFGGQSSLVGVVTSVSMDSNDLVVAKVLGFHPVAILSRAQGLMNIFHRDIMSAVRNVALPAFAAAHRDQKPLSEPLLRSISMILVLAWPFYGLVAVYANEIVLLMYGSQWVESIGLVPIFCVAGAVMAVSSVIPNLLIAIGRIDLMVKMELIIQPTRFVLIALAAVVFRSVEACATAYLIAALIALPVAWYFKRRCVADDVVLIKRLLLATAATAAAVVAPALMHISARGWSRSDPIPLVEWLLVVLLGTLSGAWVLARMRHPLADEPWLRILYDKVGLR